MSLPEVDPPLADDLSREKPLRHQDTKKVWLRRQKKTQEIRQEQKIYFVGTPLTSGQAAQCAVLRKTGETLKYEEKTF